MMTVESTGAAGSATVGHAGPPRRGADQGNAGAAPERGAAGGVHDASHKDSDDYCTRVNEAEQWLRAPQRTEGRVGGASLIWSHAKAARFAAYNPSLCGEVLVILGFALGSFVIMAAGYMLPLAHVSQGPGANVLHFAMLGFMGLLMYQLPVALIAALTRTRISTVMALKALVPGSLVTVGLCMLLSYTWLYPAPFVPLTCTIPGFATCLIVTYKQIPAQLRRLPKTRRMLAAASQVSALIPCMMVCWGSYIALFMSIAEYPVLQFMCAFILPGLKSSFRWVMLRTARLSDPNLGPCFVFIIEYFHILFIAVMLDSAGPVVALLLVAFDLAMNLFHVVKVGCLLRVPKQLRSASDKPHKPDSQASAAVNGSVATPQPQPSQVGNWVRTSGSPSSTIAPHAAAESLPAKGVSRPRDVSSRREAGGGSEHPDVDHTLISNTDRDGGRAGPSEVLQRWKMLQAEGVVLTEFGEWLVPLQSVLFLICAFYGPNRSHWSVLSGPRADTMWISVAGLSIWMAIELLGFAVMLALLVCTDGCMHLHLLSFSIREHTWVLTAAVWLGSAFTTGFLLAHNGCDFTLQVWSG